MGQKRGPRRTGAKQRDCDGKRRPQLTSHALGARKEGGLNWETERPGECQDDKSTTCVRKKERDRFVGCNYTRKKTPMRNSRRTYAANPSTEIGRNSKNGTNVLHRNLQIL